MTPVAAASSVLIVVFFNSVVAQVNFSGASSSSNLPKPKPCGDIETFCGEDAAKYPVEEINRIFKSTEALRSSAEAFDRFFRVGVPLNEERPSDSIVRSSSVSSSLVTACASRTELIPRFARAKNIKGKWKYVLQGTNGNVQNYQIIVCSSPGEVCVNDLDSPAGDGRTICRQIYKTEKLLALDESGDVVVDTFPLPSACVCHFRESPLSSDLIAGRIAPTAEVIGSSESDKDKVDTRCEETENKLNSILVAKTRSAFSSFTFPGPSDNSRTRKRKVDSNGDEGISGRIGGGDDDGDDNDRIYFGSRSSALRIFRGGQGVNKDLWEGKRRRRRRQIGFEKSTPLGAGTEAESDSRKIVPVQRRNNDPEESDCSDEICRSDPDYPLTRIISGLSRHGTLDDKKAFSSLFGATCGNATGLVDISLRQTFDLKESPLCKAYQKYIFPQKALTVRGEYRYIINTEEYQQGVTVETCSRRAKGRSCKYGGRDGNYPFATACKQMYSLQNMLAIDDRGSVYVETFQIPSACVCELIDKDQFEP